MPKKKELGNALVRQIKHKKLRLFNHGVAGEADEFARLPYRSITQETTLDDFLHTANLSNTDFAAQKLDIKVLSKAEIVGVLTPKERARRRALMEENKSALTVLKRPKINRAMTREAIIEMEHEAYLEWRQNLAKLDQLDGVVITPYERNLEFWRQLWQVVERSDLLIQVVDARQPLLFYSSSLNEYVREVESNKKTLILINKSDFLTTEQRKVWAKYFDSIGVRIAFFSALESQVKVGKEQEKNPEIHKELEKKPDDEMCQDFDDASVTPSEASTIQEKDDSEGEENSEDAENALANNKKEERVVNRCEILSVHELIDELLQLGTKREGCAYLTVGFLGYPNVGKSSTLNALCGAKKTSVSATPGKTKHYQTIFLQSDLQLCDCPGMVMPSFAYTKEDLVVAGILPIDEMHDYIQPVRVICEQIPREVLSSLYGIKIRPPKKFEDQNRPPTPHELLTAYACSRGFMATKGNPHYDRAARIILKDYVKGRLRYCHPPPCIPAPDYQMLGASERLAEFHLGSSSTGAAQDDDEAVLLRLSVYLAPEELHKLRQRRQHVRQQRAAAAAKNVSANKGGNDDHDDDDEEEELISQFDRATLASQQSRMGAYPLVRSNKALPIPVGASADGDGESTFDGDDSLSTSSWSTVRSGVSSVGGASLLSGAGSSVLTGTTAAMGKKPWRQLSEAKKSNRNRKEKLRRVHKDLDKYEVE